MKEPKITILMPTYNAGRYLRPAIESVLAQTFTDFELLIIDDQSTDGSLAVLNAYDDPRIRVVQNEQNIGLVRSRNNGLRLASGEYIAVLDADDVTLPNRLEEQVRCLREQQDVGIVASGSLIIDAEGNTLETHNYDMSPEQMYCTLTFANEIFHSSVTFRRQLILGIGGYDESFKYAEDYDLWLRASRFSKIVKLNKILVKWRQTETGISRRFAQEVADCANEVYLKHVTELVGAGANRDDLLRLHDYGDRGNYRSLLLLDQILKRLAIDAPKGLQQDKVEEWCKNKLEGYIISIVSSFQVIDTAKMLLDARFRTVLLKCIRQRFGLSQAINRFLC
jgi:hypothetical protein